MRLHLHYKSSCRVSTQGRGKRAPSKGTFALNSTARLLIYLQHRCWKVEGSSRPLELRHRITSTSTTFVSPFQHRQYQGQVIWKLSITHLTLQQESLAMFAARKVACWQNASTSLRALPLLMIISPGSMQMATQIFTAPCNMVERRMWQSFWSSAP